MHRSMKHGHRLAPYPLHHLILSVMLLLASLVVSQHPEVGRHAAPQIVQQVLALDPSGPGVILPLATKEPQVMLAHLLRDDRSRPLVHLGGWDEGYHVKANKHDASNHSSLLG